MGMNSGLRQRTAMFRTRNTPEYGRTAGPGSPPTDVLRERDTRSRGGPTCFARETPTFLFYQRLPLEAARHVSRVKRQVL